MVKIRASRSVMMGWWASKCMGRSVGGATPGLPDDCAESRRPRRFAIPVAVCITSIIAITLALADAEGGRILFQETGYKHFGRHHSGGHLVLPSPDSIVRVYESHEGHQHFKCGRAIHRVNGNAPGYSLYDRQHDDDDPGFHSAVLFLLALSHCCVPEFLHDHGSRTDVGISSPVRPPRF